MATNSYVTMNFRTVCGKAFVFDEIQTVKNVDADSFEMSTLPAERSWIWSKDNKFVVINFEQKNFEAQTMNAAQLSKPECQFEVKLYKENNLDTFKRAVIVYHLPASSGAKPMVACCNEDNSIHAEEMDLPREIMEPAHKAVFLRQEITTSTYELRSSLYKNKYLGFKESECEDGLYTLVLLEKAEDVVDEACQISISKCK
uniref:IL-18 n=1 Tax=Miichthys miiuy TaxID=240162 RepID=A0A1S6EEV7_MIIMI|nr:IL-18 [Miichthys miiuy]